MNKNPYPSWIVWTFALILAMPAIIWLSIWSLVGVIDPWWRGNR